MTWADLAEDIPSGFSPSTLILARAIGAAMTGAATPSLEQAFEVLERSHPGQGDATHYRAAVIALAQMLCGDNPDLWMDLLIRIVSWRLPDLVEVCDGRK